MHQKPYPVTRGHLSALRDNMKVPLNDLRDATCAVSLQVNAQNNPSLALKCKQLIDLGWHPLRGGE